MASILRIGPQQWRAQIRRKGYPQLCRTFLTRPDAHAWAAQVEAEMRRGTFVNQCAADSFTLREAIGRYLREVTPTKKGAKQERNRLRLWQRTPLADRPLVLVWSGDLATYRDQKLAQGASPTTVLHDLRVLSHVFTIARTEWGIQVANPLAAIRMPKLPRGRDRRLEGDEEARLLASAKEPIRTLILVAIDTAMRAGELLSLRWETLDLDRQLVTLIDTKNGDKRRVPLTRRATAALTGLVRREDGFVFPRIDNSHISHYFERVCRAAGIEGLRFHDLRHEGVSRLFERGFNPMEVSAISGHKTFAMLKRYTHLRAEDFVPRLD